MSRLTPEGETNPGWCALSGGFLLSEGLLVLGLIYSAFQENLRPGVPIALAAAMLLLGIYYHRLITSRQAQ